MSIPLYFAADYEEIVTIPKRHDRALTGFGLYPDGSIRKPPDRIPALAVIDDAFLPQKTPEPHVLDMLADVCGQGCFFDFVRPQTPLHRALARGLQARLPQMVPLFLPEPYHALAPESICVLSRVRPCNHWARYLEAKGGSYPAGWCLELIPWHQALPQRRRRACRRTLPYACCELEMRGDELYYFDTAETLRLRLKVAQEYGCRAAIGLYRELKELA